MFPGRPAMPVYWALGYHLCRWGYGGTNGTWETVRHLRNYGIPQVRFRPPSLGSVGSGKLKGWLVCGQDVQWNDIDYMDRKLDFTLDSNFSSLPDMIADLHAHHQRYVLILVPGAFVSSVCARVCARCSPLTAVSTRRTRASAARSPRARTGRTRTG